MKIPDKYNYKININKIQKINNIYEFINGTQKISGIYAWRKKGNKIIRRINKKLKGFRYFGCSTNIRARIESYINGTADNECGWELSKDILENLDDYELWIIEEIDQNDIERLQWRERYYIETCKTMYPKGFNMNNGGDYLPGRKICDEKHKEFIKTKESMYNNKGRYYLENYGYEISLEYYQRTRYEWYVHLETGEIRDESLNRHIYNQENLLNLFGWVKVQYEIVRLYVLTPNDHFGIKLDEIDLEHLRYLERSKI